MKSIMQMLGRIAFWGVLSVFWWSCQGDLPVPSSQADGEGAQGSGGQEPGSTPSSSLDPLDESSSGPSVSNPHAIDSYPIEECDDATFAELFVELGEAFAPEGIVRAHKDICRIPAFRGVASRGMRLKAELVDIGRIGQIELVRFEAYAANSGYSPEAQRVGYSNDPVMMEWTVSQTGEYLLAVDTVDRRLAGEFQLEVTCLEHCDRAMTRFPIVLMHGMGGTDSYLGILEYYFGVEDAMEEAGYDVYVTAVNPFAHSQIRARELVPQLEEILYLTGARRLNLIGHSQGGLDGRILLSELDFGDRVASFTSIAAPHRGSPIADFMVGLLTSNKITEELVEGVVDFFGSLFGHPQPRLADQLRELTQDYMVNEFNPSHPDDPRVAYYSWTGRTCALVEIDCQREWNGEVVIPTLAATYWANVLLGAEANDGLVPVESAIWGEFLGVLPADHYDEVGQFADIDNPSFDHIEFFLSEGRRLFDAGF